MIRIATNRQMRKLSNKYTKQIFDFCCVKTEKEFYKIELKLEVKNNNSSKIHLIIKLSCLKKTGC